MALALPLRSLRKLISFVVVAGAALVLAPASPASAAVPNSVAIEILGPNPTTPGSQVEVKATFVVNALSDTEANQKVEIALSAGGATIGSTFQNSPGLLFCERNSFATGMTCDTLSTGTQIVLFTVDTSGEVPPGPIVVFGFDKNDNSNNFADINLTNVAINSVTPAAAVVGQPIDVEVGYFVPASGSTFFSGVVNSTGTVAIENLVSTPPASCDLISATFFECDGGANNTGYLVTFQIKTLGVDTSAGPVTVQISARGDVDWPDEPVTATATIALNTVTIDSVSPNPALTETLVDVQATFEIAGLGATQTVSNFVSAGTVQNIVFPGGLDGCDIASDSRGFTCPVTAPQTYVVTYRVNVTGVPAGTGIIVTAFDNNSATSDTETLVVGELPATGAETRSFVLLGFALIGIGFGARLLTRAGRRPTSA